MTNQYDYQQTEGSQDKIGIGNVAPEAAVAAGRGARAYSWRIIISDSRLWPFLIALLLVIAGLIYYLLRPDIPDAMAGEFNVAVAEFIVVNEEGEVLRSDEGQEVAQWLFGRLDSINPEIGLLGIGLWFPVALPRGEWNVVASSANASASGSLIVGGSDPAISAIPDLNINPFEDRSCGTYSAGEQVQILGANFPPNSQLPFGIYYRVGGLELVSPLPLTTDNQGNFRTSIPLDSSYSAGLYYVVVLRDPDSDGLAAQTWDCFEVQ